MQLIVIHGALGSAQQLEPLARELSKHFTVHNLNLPGHGQVEFEGFSVPVFAEFVVNYIDKNNLKDVIFFGYSMGGYVGMYIARHYPGKLNMIITLATKYNWTKETALKETKFLDPELTEKKVPAFAEILKHRHADWKELMRKTALLITGLGENNLLNPPDYSVINVPCLLLLGDHDKMISFEETVNTYRSLPSAQMCILPNTDHFIEKINPNFLSIIINQFAIPSLGGVVMHSRD